MISSIQKDWSREKLGNILKIKHGYAFKGEFFSNCGSHIVLTPGNFNEEGGFRLRTSKEKWYTGVFPEQYILKRNDLIIAMTEQGEGLLGSAALVPDNNKYLHNQRLGLVTDFSPEGLNYRFAYYLFNTSLVRRQIRATANGAKVRHTSPSRIYEIEVLLPPVSHQSRIAAILSSYDDLIENNTRRIQILEQMAQMLYREWFVEFRYPGQNEHSAMLSDTGQVPKGWEAKNLGQIAYDVRRNVNIDQVDPDTPYVGLEHIPRRSIALSEWGTAKDVQSMKLRFDKGDILFGKIRPYFHKVSVAPIAGVCSSDTIVIRPYQADFYAITLCCVSSDDFVLEATQTSQGTKMPRANWDVLKRYPVAIPPAPLLLRFNDTVSRIISQIEILTMKNRNLRKTRDLLLPKLISGEIDISEVDIAIGESN